MANVGTAALGQVLQGNGNGAGPTYRSIGANSGLTTHGVVLSQGMGAFTAASPGTAGQVMTSNGAGSDPTFQAASSSPIGALSYFATAGGTTYPNPNWILCDNSIYLQATYPTLFSRIGLINQQNLWTVQTPATASVLQSVTYGTQYVATGSAGAVNTSTDGITWTNRTTGTTSGFVNVRYSNSLYVFSSSAGGLYSSTDAITYTQRIFAGDQLGQSSFGAALYVVSAYYGVKTSTDLVTWTYRNTPISAGVSVLNFVNNLFVSGGVTSAIMTSTDAITWQSNNPTITKNYTSPTTQGPVFLYGDKFLGLSAQNQNTYAQGVVTSTDGINYIARTTATTTAALAAAWATGTYVIGGYAGMINSSTDGITWTARTSGTASNIYAMTKGTLFLGVGAGGMAATSTNGVTWSLPSTGTTFTLYACAALAVTNSYAFAGAGGLLYTSTNGVAWTVRTSGTSSTILCMTAGLGLYVYGGAGGVLATSADGVTWTPRTSNTTGNISTLAFVNNKFFYGSSDANSLGTSTDGITWTNPATPLGDQPLGFAFNTNYYAANRNGIATSTDGLTWTKQTPSPNNMNTNDITFGASKYVAAGKASGTPTLMTSSDAKTWVTQTTGATDQLISLLFANGTFTLGALSGDIRTSTDAVTWSAMTSNTASNVNGLANNGAVYVAVGGGTFSGVLIDRLALGYSYNSATQFQVPLDAQLGITVEGTSNFQRKLYIKAL